MEGDPVLEELARHLAALAYGDGELDHHGVVPGGYRDRFIRLTPLSRAVDLTCALVAQLVCDGGLTIRDRMDEKIENRRTMAILNLFVHSVDGGITPGATFVEDVMTDYLLDGNGLVVPTEINMIPRLLTRYRPHGAHTFRDGGPLAYQALRAHGNGTLETVSARDMMHVRWPLKQRGQLGEHGREYFAPAPVTLFARAMVTAILQGSYVERRYRHAPTAQVWVDYERLPAANAQFATPEQRGEVQERLATRLFNAPAFVAFGGSMSEMSSAPVHEHVMEAREYQLRETAGIYGLPLPLLGAAIGQWTRGVNEQVMKMAWRTGISVHLRRFLVPFQTRLLLPGERFVVDPTELVRGDSSAVAELINALQGDAQKDPVASREELRHISGLARVPDGDIAVTRTTKGGDSNDET